MADAIDQAGVGQAKQPHPEFPDRWADGTVRPGFPGPALKHGVHSYEKHGASALPDVLRQTVEQFREAVIADRGGASELSTLEAAYIRRLSEVETVTRLLASDLVQRGLMTAKGRVRGTFTRWLEALDRWDRLAQRIGVQRMAKPALTLDAYLRDREAAQHDGHGTDATDHNGGE